jgi:hypothetical protein
VSFPLYSLLSKPPEIEGSVLFYRTYYKNKDTGTISANIRFIDDLSIDKPTLGQRRAIMASNGAKLLLIKKAYHFLGDFIGQAKSGRWYIDNLGRHFKYEKQVYADLNFYKIKKIIPGKTTGSIIEVEGIPTRFKTLFNIPVENQYAGILSNTGSHILIGTFEKPYKSSRRKI